jgi:hypothetical protein
MLRAGLTLFRSAHGAQAAALGIKATIANLAHIWFGVDTILAAANSYPRLRARSFRPRATVSSLSPDATSDTLRTRARRTSIGPDLQLMRAVLADCLEGQGGKRRFEVIRCVGGAKLENRLDRRSMRR